MTTRRLLSVALLSLVWIGAFAATSAAQTYEVFHSSSPVLRVWQDYVLPAGREARNVVVISGNATINGEIDGDLIVVLGSARLANTAVIRTVSVLGTGRTTET